MLKSYQIVNLGGMINLKIVMLLLTYLKEWLSILSWFLGAKLKTNKHKEFEIVEIQLHRLMKEYVEDYYYTSRTHQGIYCKTPIPSTEYPESKFTEGKMIPNEILGGLYHTCKKLA